MDFTPTNLPIENEYPKLVRDRIPEILQKRGLQPETSIIENADEYLKALLQKMVEESVELRHAHSEDNTKEELADIFELIYTILKLKNWSLEQIIEIQKEKREKNGGFDRKILMLSRPNE